MAQGQPHLAGLHLPATAPCCIGGALESRGGAIEYEDGADFVEQEAADAPEEPQEVPVLDEVSVRVAHGLHELEQPDGRVCTANTGVH